MIRFHCKNCGQKLKIADIYAGKKAKCPKCKNVIVLPKIPIPKKSARKQTDSKDVATAAKKSTYELTLLDVKQDKDQKQQFHPNGTSVTIQETEGQFLEETTGEQIEQSRHREFPWILDVFMYPASPAGLINLSIFVGVPLVVRIIQILLGPFAIAFALPSLIINILIGLYMYWYFAECVRDSAGGGTRAPESFATAGAGEMFLQSMQLLACYLLLLGPVFFYFLYTHKTDTTFWILLVLGVFFFPMALLAVVMFNSSAAFNPILWIASIFSTFFQYCGLVLLISGILLLVRALKSIQTEDLPLGKMGTLFFGAVIFWFFFYMVLVAGHLLGRFYWLYQEKLNWEV